MIYQLSENIKEKFCNDLLVNSVDSDREVPAYAWCSAHPESQNWAPYQIHHQRAARQLKKKQKID